MEKDSLFQFGQNFMIKNASVYDYVLLLDTLYKKKTFQCLILFLGLWALH